LGMLDEGIQRVNERMRYVRIGEGKRKEGRETGKENE
jgi:hypothetical protein